MPNAATAREEIPRLLEQLLDLAEKLDNGQRSPMFREIEDRTDEIATIVMADADFVAAEPPIDEWTAYKLTAREREVLNALASRKGKIVTRLALMERLYGDHAEEIGERILDVFICRIRAAIEQSGYTIESVPSIGFKLIPKSESKASALLPRVEWHGVFLGAKQAAVAKALHSRLGQPISRYELFKMTGEHSLGSQSARMVGLRKVLASTPYEIKTIPAFGYEMQLREIAAGKAA